MLASAMITASYCQTMAAYNAWMNDKLYHAAATLSDEERKRDRGAFFRSIHSTLNHLLYGDAVWLARFPGAPRASYSVRPNGEDTHDDFAALRAARRELDADITAWAAQIDDARLTGPLVWFSKMTQTEWRRPLALCVMQMFNHQTHHRGQVSTLLMQAGIDPGVTDLPWAPLVRDSAGRVVLGAAFGLD